MNRKFTQLGILLNVLIFVTLTLVIGCYKDPCEDIFCKNGGTCIEGICKCPNGYEGENCEIITGYDCISGRCTYVSYYSLTPDYKTYLACQNNCGFNNSECFSTPYYGQQSCGLESVAVSPTGCCKSTHPYYGVQKNSCYLSCQDAKNAGNSSISYGTGFASNLGYNCINGSCVSGSSNSDYNTLSACLSNCGSSNCFSTPYSGPQNCNSGVAVNSSSCCPLTHRYLGTEKGNCYATCEAAKNAGNSTIVYGTGETSGTNTSGRVIFYLRKDQKCGTITVNLAGLSQNITSFYSSTPNCGAAGCATFSLQPGNYTYTAKCTGFTWTAATISIVSGGCAKVYLN
jgi:hypothetical protein